ncbi:hypothetical protein [Spiroplasma poulsonii]|uniref:Uncharacterized protein n=2 Tax=Spiroplasma poulsonii TaxID=2138 RepID=A0A2P6F8D7_9MOLU|nr:hypothetical protein [Spiroplasma poulsonii]PQM29708.1 hypothetical protein SMSRO_SF031090 [Spiroplasma poulsonii]
MFERTSKLFLTCKSFYNKNLRKSTARPIRANDFYSFNDIVKTFKKRSIFNFMYEKWNKVIVKITNIASYGTFCQAERADGLIYNKSRACLRWLTSQQLFLNLSSHI